MLQGSSWVPPNPGFILLALQYSQMICYFSKPPLRSWAELQTRQDILLALLPTLGELDPLLRTPLTCTTKAGSVSKDSNSTPVLNHPSPKGVLWSGMSHLLGFYWQCDDLEHRTLLGASGAACASPTPTAHPCTPEYPEGKMLSNYSRTQSSLPTKSRAELSGPTNPKPQSSFAKGPQQLDWLWGLLGFL